MRIVIAGGGTTGRELALQLAAAHEVVVLEKNERAEELQSAIDGKIIAGDVMKKDEINLLSCLGAKNAGAAKTSLDLGREDVLLATGPDDRENLLVALTAKSFGLEHIVTVPVILPLFFPGNGICGCRSSSDRAGATCLAQ
ncbi:MAG: hypothetical protein GX167_09835 [Firmicutes bacterium]|nr:hypothetical protein [Bacillota bacterium]